MKRLLSGIRPTSSLHIGHYLGVLRNWAKLQDEHECFYFIADWHTLTTKYKETEELQKNILEVAKDIFSSGVDPNKATIYVQSAVPEVAELHLLLSMVTYQNWVERDPTLKDMIEILIYQNTGISKLSEDVLKVERELGNFAERFVVFKAFYQKLKSRLALGSTIEPEIASEILEMVKKDENEFNKIYENFLIKEQYENTERKIREETTYGLYGYPVLMTSDILSVLGEFVPVGKDQVAHIEISREIARRFNHLYKTDLFPEPKSLLTETPSVPGIDGRKMSKSYGNDIKIEDSSEDTLKKVKQMITDPNRMKKTDPGNPANCQVAYKHYEIFADKATLQIVNKECTTATIGCIDCKIRLGNIINSHFAEIREKRTSLNNEKELLEILNSGNKKARQVVKNTLEKVRDAMKLKQW